MVSKIAGEKKWYFLPAPDEGKEVVVEDYNTLLNGLERTYLRRLGSPKEGSVESMFPILLKGVFSSLRELTKDREFTYKAGRSIIDIFLSLQTFVSLAAALAHDECYDEFIELIKWGINKKGKIKIGDLESLLMHPAYLKILKHKLITSEKILDLSTQTMAKVQFHRLIVIEYLHEKHPKLNIDPDSLFDLPKKYRDEGRQFLRKRLKNAINAKDDIREVFRKPKSSQRRDYDELIVHT